MNLNPLYYMDAEFSPLDISGLQLWVDAADTTTLFQDDGFSSPVTADGDPVGGWLDKSGYNHNATQDTLAKRPSYKVAGQNGLSILQLDGADDSLIAHDPGLISAFTVFAVVRVDSSAAFLRIIGQHLNNDNRWFMQTHDLPSPGYMSIGSSTSSTWLFVASTDYFLDFGIVMYQYLSGSIFMEIDGANVGSDSGGPASLNNTGDPITIGSKGEISHFWNGDIAEILFYERALSSSERENITNYLSQKWGIRR